MRSWGTHCRTRRIAWERTGQGFVQSQRAKKTVAQCCPIRWHLSGAIKYREVHKELVILDGKTKLPRFNSDPMNNTQFMSAMEPYFPSCGQAVAALLSASYI